MKAWANSFHHETDPNAGTGAKSKAGNTYYWYGYKVHLAVDADSELPISFDVTAANTYDGHRLAPVLELAREQFDWFNPKNVLADKGYDSKAVFQFVGEDLKATPVIDVRQYKSKTKAAREAQACEAMPVITPTGTHYRCERVPYDPFCTRFGKCPLLPLYVDSPFNQDVRAPYYERYSPFPYGSKEWKALYNKRVSVERVFGRLKGYRKLNAIRTRRIAKVWLHVALSLLAMNAAAVVNVDGDVRKCVA